MTLLEDLLGTITVDAPIRSILVGIHWTVVCSRHCGLASTLQEAAPHGHQQIREVGTLHEKTARQLAEYVLSENLLEASLGLAALNSLLEIDASQAAQINALDVLIQKGKGKTVALVGHFPFIPRLRPHVGKLWVFEQNPGEGEFPPQDAGHLIPQAHVVAITGSALINHTLESLLSLCRPDALVMVLGPSTPLSPVLFDYGVTYLAGSQVLDEPAVLRTVGQGAGFQQVQGVQLLTLTHPKVRQQKN